MATIRLTTGAEVVSRQLQWSILSAWVHSLRRKPGRYVRSSCTCVRPADCLAPEPQLGAPQSAQLPHEPIPMRLLHLDDDVDTLASARGLDAHDETVRLLRWLHRRSFWCLDIATVVSAEAGRRYNREPHHLGTERRIVGGCPRPSSREELADLALGEEMRSDGLVDGREEPFVRDKAARPLATTQASRHNAEPTVTAEELTQTRARHLN